MIAKKQKPNHHLNRTLLLALGIVIAVLIALNTDLFEDKTLSVPINHTEQTAEPSTLNKKTTTEKISFQPIFKAFRILAFNLTDLSKN